MMKKALVVIFAAISAFFVLGAYFAHHEVYRNGYLNEPVNVVIEKGDGVKRVAYKLQKNGVIKYPYLFELVVRFHRYERMMKAGEYRFEPKMSLYDAMMIIVDGKVFLRKITLPEGLTTRQMLNIIAADENLFGEITLAPKEGEMLPETYTYSYGDKKDDIVAKAQKDMAKAVENEWKNREQNQLVRNINEFITLASIVEKETAIPEERPLIASVFINRLNKRMRLQTDPTVIYAITKGQFDLGRALRKKDLSIDDRYNTYVYYGLPPSPICNPSKEALYAVAHPAKSDFLYFVADGKGGHNFSATLSEHNKNVAEYVKKLKQARKK